MKKFFIVHKRAGLKGTDGWNFDSKEDAEKYLELNFELPHDLEVVEIDLVPEF